MENRIKRMPALFVGHGSPMNAIEDNEYSRSWAKIAAEIPKPEAIISISAHWFTDGTRITDAEVPKTVYDMYGFPEALYQVKYQPKGSTELAHLTMDLIGKDVKIDNSWGCDHGTWSVLNSMYPDADIPVFQLSIDGQEDAETHYEIGKKISALRDKGVMIFGSGNVVHNLSKVNWDMESGYPWAIEFDNYITDKIVNNNFQDIINYKSAGESARQAFYTPEHFYPLLCVLGAARDEDKLTVFNQTTMMGALSMTCFLFE
jgi:4,5-DOPA dioxygenase extradiol